MVTTVGLDLAFLQPGATGGMEVYARALVPALATARPDLALVVFCGRELASELRDAPWSADMRVIELPVSSGSRFRRVAVEQALEPLAVRRAGVDLVHALGNTAPLGPLGVPLVVTVHDLIWARYPETHKGLLARGLSLLVPAAVRRARRVIAVSEATATDLVALLRTPREKIDVVPQGPGMSTGTVVATPERELRARHRLGEGPLVLCPSPGRPHKNLARLERALDGLDATLVAPGYERPGSTGRTRYLGWVSDADMEGLYDAATCLAFPSLAEGFGLPVLEAMARGLPVACADATALPEVAGDAALLFDPLDERAIREAVERLLSDAELRERLARRGRDRAARFTWESCAAATLATYERACGPPPG